MTLLQPSACPSAKSEANADASRFASRYATDISAKPSVSRENACYKDLL